MKFIPRKTGDGFILASANGARWGSASKESMYNFTHMRRKGRRDTNDNLGDYRRLTYMKDSLCLHIRAQRIEVGTKDEIMKGKVED